MLDCAEQSLKVVEEADDQDVIKNYAKLAATLIRAGAPFYGVMRHQEERKKRRRGRG